MKGPGNKTGAFLYVLLSCPCPGVFAHWRKSGATQANISMTNTIAIGLALIIIGFFIIDFSFFDSSILVFLGRKMFALTEYLAFWR